MSGDAPCFGDVGLVQFGHLVARPIHHGEAPRLGPCGADDAGHAYACEPQRTGMGQKPAAADI
jgi:hypothetical protein